MKAVVFEEHGGVDVLKYTDVPEPEISPNEVLIKIKASGCNYNDIWARRGLPGVSTIMPHISGSDAAGEIVGVGGEVSNVKVGDEVVVFSSLSCGTVRGLRARRCLLLPSVQDMGLPDRPPRRRSR